MWKGDVPTCLHYFLICLTISLFSFQKSACIAVRNVVYHNTEYSGTFRELEIADLVNAVLAKHSTARDEAKAALRDLGCKVELKELWKGEKGSIPQ